MLKVLLKKQLTEMFRGFFYDQKKKTARSRSSTVLWILMFLFLTVVMLGGIFTGLAVSLCGPLAQAGVPWLYFSVMSLLALVLGVFGSAFNTHAALYLAKDNDFLFSMPIPVRTIIASRLLGVYLMGLLYSALVMLPAVAVYWVVVSHAFSAVLGGILLVAVISVFVLTLSCLLGFAVAKISVKLKNKSYITVILSLAFIGAYYFFYFKAQALIQMLVANASLYGEKIRQSAAGVYFFGRMGEGDYLSMLAFTAAAAGLGALTWYILSRSFLQIASAAGVTARAVYREKRAKLSTPGQALLRRERLRFTSTPMYMLNCGLGILLLPAGGIALLLKGDLLVRQLGNVLGERPGSAVALFAAAVCLLASMNGISTPSVSLEGKALWIVRSMPVSARQILRAKLGLHLLFTLPPMAFCLICGAFALREEGFLSLLIAGLTALSFGLFSGLLGLFLGLKMPMLDWTSETVPIKQNMSVLIAMFGEWGYALLLGGGYVLFGFLLGAPVYFGGFLALTLLASLLLWRWIETRGVQVFEAL